MVIAFLAASVLIALLATKDPAGNITISDQAVGAVCAFSILMGLGLWLLMKRIAKTFVSFSRRGADPFTNQNS
jgi:phosphate/sulfate permease